MTITHNPDANSVYEEVTDTGSHWVYRASSLGGCQNALACARRNLTPASTPQDLQNRFDLGKELEPIILERLRARYGFKLYGYQSVVEMEVGSKVLVRGHVDALADEVFEITHFCGVPVENVSVVDREPKPGIVVVDAKSVTTSSIERWLKDNWTAFPHYYWQQSFYVTVPGYSGVVMAFFDKVVGNMVVDYWPVEKLATKGDIIRRVLAIENMVKDPKLVFAEPCNPREYPCPYFRFHPQLPEGEIHDGVLEGVNTEDLVELGRLHEAARQRMNEAKAEKDELTERITKAFGHKAASLKLSDLTITCFHQGVSVVDWDGLAKKLGMTVEEAKKEFVSSKPSKTLSVRVSVK
jgi:hypothetical protein